MQLQLQQQKSFHFLLDQTQNRGSPASCLQYSEVIPTSYIFIPNMFLFARSSISVFKRCSSMKPQETRNHTVHLIKSPPFSTLSAEHCHLSFSVSYHQYEYTISGQYNFPFCLFAPNNTSFYRNVTKPHIHS